MWPYIHLVAFLSSVWASGCFIKVSISGLDKSDLLVRDAQLASAGRNEARQLLGDDFREAVLPSFHFSALLALGGGDTRHTLLQHN